MLPILLARLLVVLRRVAVSAAADVTAGAAATIDAVVEGLRARVAACSLHRCRPALLVLRLMLRLVVVLMVLLGLAGGKVL